MSFSVKLHPQLRNNIEFEADYHGNLLPFEHKVLGNFCVSLALYSKTRRPNCFSP